ncbi:MAG TPA: hypothetical protein VFZ21_05275 [Gemmatimonadaceae bacterium]|jgi:hypothetical protein|nr:hypothetical protein [Gemmatimonadaceae bacterium]
MVRTGPARDQWRRSPRRSPRVTTSGRHALQDGAQRVDRRTGLDPVPRQCGFVEDSSAAGGQYRLGPMHVSMMADALIARDHGYLVPGR